MIDPTTAAGARALERLGSELIAWLTTVTPAGQPQASPVWFLWADGEMLVYSRASTPRPGNIRGNPRVAITFNSSPQGGDVLSLEGEARIVRDRTTPGDVPEAYVTKYAARLAANGWTLEGFLRDHPVEIRIRLTRVRAT
jgi:PPOX class probable F420-dependent enzyme